MAMNDSEHRDGSSQKWLNIFDDDGKCSLDHIYNKPDPRPYFTTLGKLEYLIPQLAKPVFLNLLGAYSEVKGEQRPKVIDLGCSYGVNAALLKCGMDLDQLYALYGTPGVRRLGRDELIARDREIFSRGNGEAACEIVGMDAAPEALAYAREARIIDGEVAADLEREALAPDDRKSLDDADLVISTGCIGYVSEKTITRIVAAGNGRLPWMAHFVLRMFSYEPIRQALAALGYVTAKGSRPVRQRRFASRREQDQVLERLSGMGIDPSGYETEGWFYADLYVSRPLADSELVPCTGLVRM